VIRRVATIPRVNLSEDDGVGREWWSIGLGRRHGPTMQRMSNVDSGAWQRVREDDQLGVAAAGGERIASQRQEIVAIVGSDDPSGRSGGGQVRVVGSWQGIDLAGVHGVEAWAASGGASRRGDVLIEVEAIGGPLRSLRPI
jgi:hypothetical protein